MRALAPQPPPQESARPVKHSILWHMLSTDELYNDLGGDHLRKRDPERMTKRLVAQLEALGQHVTPEEAAAA